MARSREWLGNGGATSWSVVTSTVPWVPSCPACVLLVWARSSSVINLCYTRLGGCVNVLEGRKALCGDVNKLDGWYKAEFQED